MKLFQDNIVGFSPIIKKLLYISLIIYSLSLMIHNNQRNPSNYPAFLNSTVNWCNTPDQDIFVTIEAMGHNSNIYPKQSLHPGYGHKLLYAYYFKLLNLLNVSEYHKIEDFCQTPEPLKIWPVMIKNARTLSFLLFIVFCLVMGLTCWQLTGKPWAFPIGFYFCSLFPGGQYQSFIIRSELIATIMGCTGILFALMSLNAKRYLSYITFSILSGACIFVAIITKIHALPFLFFIVVIFTLLPINKSKFTENISVKMLTIPVFVIIVIFSASYGWGALQRFSSHHPLLYKGGLLGLILVSILMIILYCALHTRNRNSESKRILQLISEYFLTKNKFSFNLIYENKLFRLTSLVIVILIIYSASSLWTPLRDKFSSDSIIKNPYLGGSIIVSFLLIFLSYLLRERLENKVLKRMLSLGYYFLGFIFFGGTILYLSLLTFHTLENSKEYWHIIFRNTTNPWKYSAYVKIPDFSVSFFYSILLEWWNIYSYLLFSLFCFSCYFLSSSKFTLYNKSIFMFLILMSYLYASFSSLRHLAPHYYIFNDVFMILGYMYLFSNLVSIINVNKFNQTCSTFLVFGWMYFIPYFVPVSHYHGPLDNSRAKSCIHWTYPSKLSKFWIHDKYLQCIQKAYPTREIYLENLLLQQ